MSLSLRQKQDFYDQLGKYLRAGVPVAGALEKLGVAASGSLRVLLRSLRQQIANGEALPEAFHKAKPALSQMERATLAGLARSGHLEAGLQELSAYFGAMHRARAAIQQRLAYPLFLLHFGVLALHAPLVVTASLGEYLKQTGLAFLVFYTAVAALWLAVVGLRDAGACVPPIDDLLRHLPFVGQVRRAFAVSRFCATYNMQLDAGINVVESLRAAGDSSRSALIRGMVSRALPEVRRGAQVGPLLALSPSALPRELVSAILVAEETGQLDRTLHEAAEEFQREAFRRLEIASEWLPRLAYVAVLLYLGWRIIAGYQSYFSGLQSQIDSL